MKLRFVFALCSTASLAVAATLRVPEDYDLVQRAVNAAAPGDTVLVGAGTFTEAVQIAKPLTLRGAGSQATRLVARHRHDIVLSVGAEGAVLVEGLALAHPPTPADEEDGAVYSSGVNFGSGEIRAHDLRVENSPGRGVEVSARADLENITIVGAASGGLVIEGTPEGTSVKNLAVSGTRSGHDVEVLPGARVKFSGLTLSGEGAGPISVSGMMTAAVFVEPLPKELSEKIAWLDGAQPGVIPPAPPAEKSSTDGDMTQEDAFFAEELKHRKASEPARREAARALQKALRAAKSPVAEVEALGAYTRAILATYNFRVPADNAADALIAAEVDALLARGRGAELGAALETWAPDAHLEEPIRAYYERILSNETLALLDQARSGDWLAENRERLHALLARLAAPTAGATTEVAAADFLKTLGELKALVADAAQNLGPADFAETTKVGAQDAAPKFLDAAGGEAFTRVLKLLGAESEALLKPAELQAKLSPDQRRAVLRAMRSTSN